MRSERFERARLLGRGLQLHGGDSTRVCPTCGGLTTAAILTCPLCRRMECVACRASCGDRYPTQDRTATPTNRDTYRRTR